jgi:glutamate/aspartate transport system substrate-binding protein
MPKHFLESLLSLVVIAATLTTDARAQVKSDTLDRIESSGVLTIGHRDSSIPFSYLDDSQRVVGF